MENLIKKSREEIRKTLAKENFIIEQHFECHNSNNFGECKICNREDTIKELLQQQVALLENLKKWAEENKFEVPTLFKTDLAYNQALEDLIQKLDKTIKEI